MNIAGREYPTPLVVGGVAGVVVLVLGQRLLGGSRDDGAPAAATAPGSQLAPGATPVDDLTGSLGQFPQPDTSSFDWWDAGGSGGSPSYPTAPINPPMPDDVTPVAPAPAPAPAPTPTAPAPAPTTTAPLTIHYQATVTVPTSLWNPQTQRWVYNGTSSIKVGTVLVVRSARYTMGGVSCYPVTSPYAGYYVPANHVRLGARI